MDIALMVEGQNGLNWPRWQRLARAAEDLGFAGLFRSDHFTNASPPDADSLELWASLTWLASHTQRIEFGPLVSPVSFRQPAITARTAAAVDDLSGGRLVLGVGAGWQDREHDHFGFDLLDVPERFARLQEGLEVITRLLRSDTPTTFDGRYFCLRDAILLPRPHRPGGPPVLIGGNGVKRTLPLVARYANEWNGVFTSPEHFGELNRALDGLLVAAGRRPQEVRRSLMVGTRLSAGGVQAEALAAPGRSRAELRARGVIAGSPEAFVAFLRDAAAAGAQRVMLQWLDLDDLAGLDVLAREVLPHFR